MGGQHHNPCHGPAPLIITCQGRPGWGVSFLPPERHQVEHSPARAKTFLDPPELCWDALLWPLSPLSCYTCVRRLIGIRFASASAGTRAAAGPQGRKRQGRACSTRCARPPPCRTSTCRTPASQPCPGPPPPIWPVCRSVNSLLCGSGLLSERSPHLALPHQPQLEPTASLTLFRSRLFQLLLVICRCVRVSCVSHVRVTRVSHE